MSGREPPPVVLLFHRPLEDPYHGASLSCAAFVNELRETVAVETVAPPAHDGSAAGPARSGGSPALKTARQMLEAVGPTLRAMVSDKQRGAGARGRVIIAFGAWAALPAYLWSRLREYPLVYFPQDYMPGIARHWRATGVVGGTFFSWVLTPVERRTLRTADLVLVHSASMRDAYERDGTVATTPEVYAIPRKSAPADPVAVDRWRTRLGLRGKVPIVFVGTFDYPPNVRAVEFIRDTLAPRLMADAPEAIVLIVGAGSERYANRLPSNVVAVGPVSDYDNLLYACRIGIAPMETSGGRSNKVIDYALHGLKVVATPQAMVGAPESERIVEADIVHFSEAVRNAVRSAEMQADAGTVGSPDPAFVSYNESSRSASIGLRVMSVLTGTRSRKASP